MGRGEEKGAKEALAKGEWVGKGAWGERRERRKKKRDEMKV